MELQDESGEGLERPGPRTGAEIVKNSTVLTEDSAASERPQPENQTSGSVGPLVGQPDAGSLIGQPDAGSPPPQIHHSGSEHFEGASVHNDAAADSDGGSDGEFYQSLSVDTAQAPSVYVPKWTATNGFKMDDPWVCRSLIDNFSPPGYLSVLRNMSSKDLLDHYNRVSAQ